MNGDHAAMNREVDRHATFNENSITGNYVVVVVSYEKEVVNDYMAVSRDAVGKHVTWNYIMVIDVVLGFWIAGEGVWMVGDGLLDVY